MEKPMTQRIARIAALAALVLAVLTAALAATHTASAARKGTKLTLVAYSAPGAAYAKLISGFQATAAGKDVTFSQSYAASEQQSKAVDQGLGADVVNFSIEPDMNRLVRDVLVAPTWKSNKYKGIVARSVVAFIVRKGNPKHIKTFAGLATAGVQVVVPTPIPFGGARWDSPSACGSERGCGKPDQLSQECLKTLFKYEVASQNE